MPLNIIQQDEWVSTIRRLQKEYPQLHFSTYSSSEGWCYISYKTYRVKITNWTSEQVLIGNIEAILSLSKKAG
jgi:hypothetical protein